MKPEKMGPGLLIAYETFTNLGDAGLQLHVRSLGVAPPAGRPRPSKTVVFVHCDEDADLSHLAQHDIAVNQKRGRVRTAYLPMSSLDPLSDDPAVHRVLAARYLKPRMDIARGKVH